MKESLGWIIVRVAEKGKPQEFLIPQKVTMQNGVIFTRDVFETTDVTLFASDFKLNEMLNKAKLARPASNLELRRTVIRMEILDL